MDIKNLEKMFEVMDFLEPVISKPINIEKNEEMKIERGMNFNNQNSGLTMKPRKPSLPLAVSAPSVRRGSVDTRQSLFHNERFQPINNRLPLFRGNLRNTMRHEENQFNEISGEEFLINHSLPKYCNDSNVYETISIHIDEEDFEKNANQEGTSENNRDTLTILSMNFPCDIEYRDNSNTLEKNKLRYSNLSDNAGHKRSDDEQLIITGLQSAPESARNSARVVSMYSKDNQSSIDSGVDQQISTNLSSYLSNDTNLSNYSFSDISESNIATCSDKETLSLNNDTKEYQQWEDPYSQPFIRSDHTLKSSDVSQAKYLHSIKTEEEQIQFYRQVSKELSLRNFSPHEIIIFSMKDGSSSQVIDKFQTAVSVCGMLKRKYNKPDNTKWQLTEVIGKESLERPVEDHENILDLFYSWENDHLFNKFFFQENPLLYKIFEEPKAFFNEMKNDFEIADVLWAKGVNSKWIYTTCYISDGVIYYTTKRGSKAQKDVYSLVNLKMVDFYTCSNPKKTKKEIKAQTSHIIVFKGNKLDHRSQENAYLAASSSQQKDKWLIALKVAKYSFTQLKNNYLESQMCFPTGFRSQANSDATLDGTYNPIDTMDL